MERITKRAISVAGNYKVCCAHFLDESCHNILGNCLECGWENMAWERLADYEDIGLSPSEIMDALKRRADND